MERRQLEHFRPGKAWLQSEVLNKFSDQQIRFLISVKCIAVREVSQLVLLAHTFSGEENDSDFVIFLLLTTTAMPAERTHTM
jgi:hypothetical protein